MSDHTRRAAWLDRMEKCAERGDYRAALYYATALLEELVDDLAARQAKEDA